LVLRMKDYGGRMGVHASDLTLEGSHEGAATTVGMRGLLHPPTITTPPAA
jgi:hypothetical protein